MQPILLLLFYFACRESKRLANQASFGSSEDHETVVGGGGQIGFDQRMRNVGGTMTRRYHPDCRVEVDAWVEQDAFACDDAEVWIEARSILISYFDADGIVVLEGVSDEAESWSLTARSRPRRATLTPVDGNDQLLVGAINEQGESVRWTLKLGDRDTSA